MIDFLEEFWVLPAHCACACLKLLRRSEYRMSDFVSVANITSSGWGFGWAIRAKIKYSRPASEYVLQESAFRTERRYLFQSSLLDIMSGRSLTSLAHTSYLQVYAQPTQMRPAPYVMIISRRRAACANIDPASTCLQSSSGWHIGPMPSQPHLHRRTIPQLSSSHLLPFNRATSPAVVSMFHGVRCSVT